MAHPDRKAVRLTGRPLPVSAIVWAVRPSQTVAPGVPVNARAISLYGVFLTGLWLAVCISLAWWIADGAPRLDPAPIVGFGALVCAGLLVFWGQARGELMAPQVIAVVPLLIGLAASTRNVTSLGEAWTWTGLGNAGAIALAPLAGIVVSRGLFGPVTPPTLRSPTNPPHAGRLVMTCVAMLVIGMLIIGYEFSTVGGPPLLSGNVDASRFSLISNGSLHVITEGVSLSMLISAWALVGHRERFSASQRLVLIGVIGTGLMLAALQGGRLIVVMPLVAMAVVSARSLTPTGVRRMAGLVAIVIFVFAAALALVRGEQSYKTYFYNRIAYSDEGTRNSPLMSGFNTLSISFGEQFRVVDKQLKDTTDRKPFSYSIYFAHDATARARDPSDRALAASRVWVTGTYAHPLILDFGLKIALLGGALIGFAAHLVYRRHLARSDVVWTWLYGSIAGFVALMFYVSMLTQFAFVWLDLAALVCLARFLQIRPSNSDDRRRSIPGASV